jgi:uncharacterized membrane protein YccC
MASPIARLAAPDSSRWLDWVAAERLVADPDGSRLRGAAGATLSAALAAGIAVVVGPLVGLPASSPMVTGVLAMIASVTVAESSALEERRTFGILFLPLTIGLTLGTALAPHPIASLVAFVLVAFTAVMLQRLGPRGSAAGTIGFHSYFFSLFFGVELREAVSVLAAGWLAVGVAAAVRFAFHRGRSLRAIQGIQRALPILAARVLRSLEGVLRHGDAASRRLRRRVAFQRLNEAALVLEDHLDRTTDFVLGRPADAAKKRAFELELAAERVGAGVLALIRSGETSEACREAIAQTLEATEAILLRRGDVADAERAIEAARAAAKGQPHVELAVARLGEALEQLTAACHPAYESRAPASTSRAPVEFRKEAPTTEGLHVTTRLAIQVSIATAVSVLVGRAISPDRWFWAAVAAYLVIAPATTRGEILVRAWRRTLGTIVGVVLGFLLATLASGHARVELGLLFACVFLAMYSRKTSHTVMVLWMTAAFALLYELTGRYSVGILYVRLEETAAGAAIGALSAALVLPSRTGTRLRDAIARFANLLGDDLEDVTQALAKHERASRSRVRALDRALLDVRASAEPLTRGGYRLSPATSELVRACSTLAFYARQLAMPGLLTGLDPAAIPELEKVLSALAANSRRVAHVLTKRAVEPAVDVPLSALRAATDRARHGDRPRELDLALLCTERMAVTLDEVRVALPK